jgi:hypothetical protein
LSQQNGSKKRTCVHKDKSNCKPLNESTTTHSFFDRYWFREKRGFIGKKEEEEAEWDASSSIFINENRLCRKTSRLPLFIQVDLSYSEVCFPP